MNVSPGADKSTRRRLPPYSGNMNQSLPIIDTLKASVAMAKQNAGRSILLCLVFGVMFVGVMVVGFLAFAVLGFSASYAASGSGHSSSLSAGALIGMIIVGIILGIVAMVVMFWGQLSLIGVAFTQPNTNDGVGTAMGRGWRAMPGFFVATLGLWAVQFGAAIVGLIIAVIAHNTAVSVLLYLAWIALSFALLPISMLVAPAAIDGGGMGSLGAARNLSRGNGWRLIGLILLFGLVADVAIFVVFVATLIFTFILAAISHSLAIIGFLVYFIALLLSYVVITLVGVSLPVAAYLRLSGKNPMGAAVSGPQWGSPPQPSGPQWESPPQPSGPQWGSPPPPPPSDGWGPPMGPADQ